MLLHPRLDRCCPNKTTAPNASMVNCATNSLLILQQRSFLEQYYLRSICPRMENSQKSLGCNYKISQNRLKAKNKIWKEQAITLFPDIAKPWSTPKRPAWQFPNLSTPAVLSPSPGRPAPAQKTGSAAKGTNFQKKNAKAPKDELRWSESPWLTNSFIHPSIHHSSPNEMGVQDSCCRLGQFPPHGTVPGRSLLSLQGSSCAPLIPTAPSAIQLSPLFLPGTDTSPARTGKKQRRPKSSEALLLNAFPTAPIYPLS